MNLNSINITEIVEQTKIQLQEDKTLSGTGKVIGRRRYHQSGITKPASNFAC